MFDQALCLRAPRGAQLRDDTILHQCPPFLATPVTQRQLCSAVLTPFTRYSTRVKQPHDPTVFSWFPLGSAWFVIPSELRCMLAKIGCARGPRAPWETGKRRRASMGFWSITPCWEPSTSSDVSDVSNVVGPCKLLPPSGYCRLAGSLGSPVPTHRSGLIFLADFYWPHRAGLD